MEERIKRLVVMGLAILSEEADFTVEDLFISSNGTDMPHLR